ncbi:hypothetical protein ABT124_39475 [Streptomyces sp. NPDC001982]|uniref:hypothetical protein n=1 Tax=Streptomyces sp. NPDC001982 TaxID=3154405 RepID=UPI00331936B5
MGNSGGAATHSGVDFQQRIAALAMSHMLCELTDFGLLGFGDGVKVDELRFETTDAIDDLILVGPATRHFVQAKNTINVSADPASEFGSVLAQFVGQYVSDNRAGDVYVLATSLEASSRIRKELRKLTEAARLNESDSTGIPLTAAEKDILEKTQELIRSHHEALTGRAITQEGLQQILARIRICSLDIREGGSLETAALIMLSSKAVVPARLLWGSLIALAVSLARDRLSINTAGLKDRMGKFVSERPEDREAGASELFTRDLLAGLSYGREVVLAKSPFEEHDFLIADFKRFDDAGAKHLKFSNGHLELAQGQRWELVGRWATWAGLEGYLQAHAEEYADKQVVMMPANLTEDPSSAPAALAHGAHCASLAVGMENAFLCRHCGDPISEDGAPLIEVDEEDLPEDIGLVHQTCRTPTDRVLGAIDAVLFRENQRLRNFDYKGWLSAIQGGQWLFGGLMESQMKLAPIAWKSEYDDFAQGGWCVRVSMEDGSANYLTDRGRVTRFSADKATHMAERMNRSIAQAEEAGDPLSYTASGSGFGPYSLVLGQGDDPIPCTKAEAVRYTRAIGDAYSACERYYAPLAYLVDAETGDPIVVDSVISLLTNPLELSSYIQNWERCGIELPEFTVSAILSDEQFDRFVRLAMTRGIGVVINPKLAPDGTLVSGYWLENFEQLTRSAERKIQDVRQEKVDQ